MRASSYAAACCILLTSGALGFAILPGPSLNHQEITEDAILSATLLTCRNIAQSVGTDFTFPSRPYTTESVAAACSSPESSKSLGKAVRDIVRRNTRVDLRHPLNGSFHFDDEMFAGGRRIIATGLSAVKASNREGNFEAARDILGEILHPLQDFYSHSNWVELGKTLPNSNLLRADAEIGNLAAPDRRTCRDCDGDDCRNNIVDDVLREGVLTSGYFAIVPLVSTKPAGKCSHGGGPDQTSTIEPKGGINKDTESASHGHLHQDAAKLAIAATTQLLLDVGQAAGDADFLRMMGVFRGSSEALCFVVDTTASMSDEMAAVKAATVALVDSRVGTSNEPSVYILVPFNDPAVGPLIRTTDPNDFKAKVNALTASGGGDSPEMSLAALKLALTAAPSESDIFLFTDASAKDTDLQSPVIALIERSRTVVNFILTGTSEANSGPASRTTSPEALLYGRLAETSGGLSVEVSKDEVADATGIVTESSTASQVTLLQASRSSGKSERFSFSVDESVQSLAVYVTGGSVNFTVTNPSGTSQSSTENTGSLGVVQSVGNLQTLPLTAQMGDWTVNTVSSDPYTLKVIGESDVDFLFDFVEMSQGPFQGLDELGARPRVGKSGLLLMSLTANSASITEASLVEPFGSGEVSGAVEVRDGGEFLARFDAIPSGAFVVRVRGAAGFQRQSSTTLQSSNLTVKAVSENIIVPGTPFLVLFTVTTADAGGNFTIQVDDDQGFVSDFPRSLVLADGGTANGTVTMSAPLNTPSGSDVTLTIQAVAPRGVDANYVVQRYSIVNTVTDFQAPACRLIRLRGDCSGNCSSSAWDLIVDVSDGSGVGRVGLEMGNGSVTTTVVAVGAGGENTTRVTYEASCCSPDVELLAVDGVGNVGTCPYTIRRGPVLAPAPQSTGCALTRSWLIWAGLALGLIGPAW